MNTLIAISGLGIITLLAEIFNGRKIIVPFTIIGLLGILGYNVSTSNPYGTFFNNMIVVDKPAVAFTSLFIAITIFLIGLSHEFYKDRPTTISDFVSIKVFLLAGAVAMVSFGNLAMFFLGIEILSVSLYVLAASRRMDLRSNEAGMKYFLMGSFASGIILFGITLIYGSTGSFDTTTIYQIIHSTTYPKWYFIGVTMLLIGMLFKIAAVPFHFWAPDVYEGAPALTTATMSTLAKVVAMTALFKLINNLLPMKTYEFQMTIVVVAALSMIVGNIMALRQNNVKRMFAFSGISHAGFMLTTLLLQNNAQNVLFYYAAAYTVAGLAFFAVVFYVTKEKKHETIDAFNGLGKSHPLLAVIMTTSLLSMAGIPILSGFFAKFFLLTELMQTGWIVSVIIAVIASIISVGYYFRIILAMYTKDAEGEMTKIPAVYLIIAVIAFIGNVAIGLYPGGLFNLLG
ncbi:NADH-quinone oxidoreductase subunit N [Flavobacterium amniphilum]|uniref:NADH-quinone oxidoreductase subunit N n=1 Tax=Flavobacterium amniphilum TaxID=1834035 RepID=UPI00202A8533|nr:NADH-quinone oxidoreductase subunit N [Flavobacterium amniphilum]MCL9806097.1 NADH-quinone oxidoreductase subunit N [Flavobacterium amniphilum]